MALTPEQQEYVDTQAALALATSDAQRTMEIERRQHDIDTEVRRREHDIKTEERRSRLELVRAAKEVLIENKRNLPVSDREVTDADIITFASALETFINK